MRPSSSLRCYAPFLHTAFSGVIRTAFSGVKSDADCVGFNSAFDGKAKVWSVETRQCVATHAETDKTLWSVKWLPKTGRNEMFAVAGANRSISFYREASGS